MNIGVVGCGAVTSLYYAPALELLENEGLLRVTTLFDPDPAAMARIGGTFPGACLAGELRELLEREVGLVIVASPPRYHAEQTILALRSGRSVLCEKPLATTAADGQAMIEAAVEAGQVLAVGMVRRFLPSTWTIRNLLARGVLGELRAVHCFEGGPFEWPVRSQSYFDRSSSGGGVFLDIGIHVLDLLTWWFGPPSAVDYQDDAMGGVEANCRIHLSYEGFGAEIQLSRDWARPNRYLLQGSRSWLSWTVNDGDRFQMGSHDSEYVSEIRLHEVLKEGGVPAAGAPASNYHQSFVEQIRSVIRAMGGEDTPIVSGKQALENVRLVEHCYQNRALLAMPWLSEQERHNARKLSGSAA